MAGKKDLIKDEDRFSIMVDNLSVCCVCGQTPTHIHEVFGGPFRAKSKQYGLCVGLCGPHHNLSNAGVHYNKDLDLKFKQQAERMWIKTYCPDDSFDEGVQKFIREFGKNYV